MPVSRQLRAAHSMDMPSKAFGMSQPVLSVHTEHSGTDNEEQSDASGSPTQSGSRPTTSAPQSQEPTFPANTSPSQPIASDSGPSRLLEGLPPISTSPLNVPFDGLPSPSRDASRTVAASTSREPVVHFAHGVHPDSSVTSNSSNMQSHASGEVSSALVPLESINYSCLPPVFPHCWRRDERCYGRSTPRTIKHAACRFDLFINSRRCNRREVIASNEIRSSYTFVTACIY